ncbi:hypothetical protein [Brevibacillus laterosporus]|uniref:hypothetical protein n=1 Tax=Brevibacillus laterosporus TaxID=1465 RepID=UPI001EF23960|nr:hypothetical protein [Brevibacillus laterosporus]
MFVLMKNDITKIDIEKEIMNSNIEYNVIAHDKELLESKDIFEEHPEAQKLHLERYLECIQIAVHATNKKAIHFWTSLGYRHYDERTYKDKVFYSLEKNLD